MSTETLTIIIACASLVVMVATLVFMVRNSKGYLQRKLRKKEERYQAIADRALSCIREISSKTGGT